MKRPYFNLEQRTIIRHDCFISAVMLLDLALLKAEREFRRSNGWIERLLSRKSISIKNL